MHKLNTTYIKKIWSENMGGGCMTDFIILDNGKCLTLNDGYIVLYPSYDCFLSFMDDQVKENFPYLQLDSIDHLMGIDDPSLKELYKNDNGKYVFEFNGVEIDNPIMDIDGKTIVDPSYYGFQITSTGSGCTGNMRRFILDGKIVLMLITDGNLNHISDRTVHASISIFDESWEETINHYYVNR